MSPPGDLRHITSATNLVPNSRIPSSNRNSQLIPRSPTSIPSSPTSVYSSSSAIFERDIEPINPSPPLHHNHPSDPHRIPRGHNSETLEHSVPSVLDSAAEILTSTTSSPTGLSPGDDEEISVIAPNPHFTIPSTSSASPVSSSRSPSPGGGFRSSRGSVLLNLPNFLPSSSPKLPAFSLPPLATNQPAAVAVPNDETTIIPDRITGTPTSAYYSLASSTSSSPTPTTVESHPLRSNTVPSLPPEMGSSSLPSPRVRQSTSSSYSPSINAAKRLSFLSYNDILTSTPSSMLPLSSLTTANQHEPPSRSLFIEAEIDGDTDRSFDRNSCFVRARNSIVDAPAANASLSGSLSFVAGEGEWEREGMGRGLEERLEMAAVAPGTPVVGIPVTAGGPGI